MAQPILNARALKVTVVLDSGEVTQLVHQMARRASWWRSSCPTGA
jgi:hypothetical protein